jgi:basic membrane protein A
MFVRSIQEENEMSRNTFSLVLAFSAVAALLLGACVPAATPLVAPTQQAAPEPTQVPAAPVKPVKVALLMPGSITDGGWDQLAYEGLQRLGKEEGFQVAFTENIKQADIPQVTRGYADDGYDLLIGHGFEFGSAFLEIAPQYPNQRFFATTYQPQPNVPANALYINPAYYDAGYAAGALAALMSKSHTVGFVGGGDNPTQRGTMNAFKTGASQTVEGTNGLGVVTGDYNDATKGREAATTMIGNGADVIWHFADITGLGAIEGAVANKAMVMGAYSDQTKLAPDNMPSSLAMDLSNMVVKLGLDVRDGTFAGGKEWQPPVDEMWHWTYDGGKSDHNSKLIADDVWAKYLTIWKDLAAGKIKFEVKTD